jgi:hypothetical protein
MKPSFPFYYSRRTVRVLFAPAEEGQFVANCHLVSMTLRRLDELKLFPLKQRDF